MTKAEPGSTTHTVMEESTPTGPFCQLVRAAARAVEEEEVTLRQLQRRLLQQARRLLQQAETVEAEEGQGLTAPLSATRALATIPVAANGKEAPRMAAAAKIEEEDRCAGEHREMKVAVMVWVLCVQERFGEVMGCFLYILLWL